MTKLKIGRLNDYLKLTRKEYDASVNALNLFFGAVIGVSLGSIGEIATQKYILLLFSTATAVMSILFVSYSERKYWSIFVAIAVIAAIWFLGSGEKSLFELPPKLLPTLAVWTAMAIFTEYADKVVEDDPDAASGD